MSDLMSQSDPAAFRATAMSSLLARNWWAMLVRGLCGIVFGILAFVVPGAALASLVVIYGVYMLIDGVFAMVAGFRAAAHHERWSLLLLEGVIDIAAGLVALLLPGITVVVFVILLAAWAVVSGIALMVASMRLHLTHGRWLMLIAGLLSVVWGVLLYLMPLVGALVLTWWVGAYALVFGAMLIGLAVQLRRRRGVVGDTVLTY